MTRRRTSRRVGGRGTASLMVLLVALGTSPLGGQEADTAAAGPEDATEERTLGLQEAVRLALSRSRAIQDARLAVENAENRVDEAWGSVYPSVDFNASYTRNVSPQVSFLPARIFDPGAPEGEFIGVQFGADNSWQTSISLEQPLFQARAFIGVSSAGRFAELQDENLRGRIHQTVTRVRTSYFDLLLAQEQLRLTERSLERVRQSLDETRAMNEAGIASDYDVLRLEVELANLEPRLRQARNGIARARRALATELDLENPEALRVRGSLAELSLLEPEANSDANREILSVMGVQRSEMDDPDALFRLARSSRADLLQLEATEDLRQAELRVEQVEYLPRVNLFGTYNIQAQQNGKPDFFGEGRQRAYARNVGIQVSVPLFTGFQRDATADQKRATLRQARTQTRLARDEARNEILDLLDAVEEARLRAEGQRLAVEQARRGYEIAAAEYREGVSGQLQLTDAEVALRQSEFNYAQAIYDYLVSRARLDRAVGRVPMVERALPADLQN